MTKQAIDEVFKIYDSTYSINGDIKINEDPFICNGDITIREDSIDIHDSKGNLKAAYNLEEVSAAGMIGKEISSIVTTNDISSTIITIKLHTSAIDKTKS
jgi:hypothetical protein